MEPAVSPDVSLALQQLGSARSAAERSAATARLLDLLYTELRRMAARLMRRETPGHTLQPTALVHEAYVKLAGRGAVRWSNRAHFLGAAARAMRQILVDRARRHAALRRGGGRQLVTLSDESAPDSRRELEVLEIHQALELLSALDERAGRVAEMRIFGGMTVAEIAQVVEVSPRTVDGDWAMAKAWLRRALDVGRGG